MNLEFIKPQNLGSLFMKSSQSNCYCIVWLEIKSSHFQSKQDTVFPHIVHAETILFWIWKSIGHSTQGQRSQYIKVRKLFKGGNYMRKYGIQFLKLFICFMTLIWSFFVWFSEGTVSIKLVITLNWYLRWYTVENCQVVLKV